jgi:hypothetical protein
MMDAYQAARESLSEFRQQDDYLLAHGASLMSEDSHEILHTDTLRRAVSAALLQAAAAARDACMALNMPNCGSAAAVAEEAVLDLLPNAK